ncbi:MAG: DUF1365 domain-containing protein [Rhodobacteraceae bacterium]|nr:DUF1365 domain-containing protein [Paracoccaceae bacterium]
MSDWPEHLAAVTTHARAGSIANAFRYSVDYVLIDTESRVGPALFSRNRANLAAVHDRDHGGTRGAGQGVAWARGVLAARGQPDARILLLTQPRMAGFRFNPVSFWLAFRGDALVAVIAEVNNTFGDRHSYFCARPGFAPITAGDEITAEKLLHVSPFQDVAGGYRFRFAIDAGHVSIRIAHESRGEGVVATLTGRRRPLTSRAILGAALRRPFGPGRTVALIYWQALKLWLKGARYRRRPTPPTQEISE